MRCDAPDLSWAANSCRPGQCRVTQHHSKEPPLQKTILISGASSGIGRATAIRLAHDGYKVLAGVRNQDAANELLATVPQNVEPVFFDITD